MKESEKNNLLMNIDHYSMNAVSPMEMTKQGESSFQFLSHKNEGRIPNILANLNNVIFETDLEGGFVYLSPSWEPLTGFSVIESLGSPIFEFIIPTVNDFPMHSIHQLLAAQEKKSQIILPFRTKSNETKWIQVSISYMKSKRGKITGTCGTFIDLTKKVEWEEERAEELQLAISVQKSVLSKPLLQENIQITGEFYPSHELSGDLFYWNQISPSQYSVFIMDVVGHGISSALVSMSIRSLLRGLFRNVQDPLEIYYELNNHMKNLNITKGNIKTFFTCIYLLIDTEEQSIHYVNAGHPAGIVIEGEKVIELDKGGVPIGILESPPLEKGTFFYNGNVEILLYTDGLLELLNKNKLKDMVAEYIDNSTTKLSKHILHAIDVSKSLPDDLCMVSVIIKNM
jgi:phosphoserine phosphatase RsbU/P